jgi:hypothetical protein
MKEHFKAWLKRDLPYIICILLLLGVSIHAYIVASNFDTECKDYCTAELKKICPESKRQPVYNFTLEYNASIIPEPV